MIRSRIDAEKSHRQFAATTPRTRTVHSLSQRSTAFARQAHDGFDTVGHGAEIRWDPGLTQADDFEAELAVVIGRTCRRVDEASALGYVAGYSCLDDVSARDLQFSDKQFVRGKSLDTFCPIGPWIVTADEIPDPQALHLSSRINGFVMQDSSTSEMIFSVRTLVSFLSQAFTLEPGDVLATGTLGVNMTYLDMGEQIATDETGLETGTFKSYMFSFGAAFGTSFRVATVPFGKASCRRLRNGWSWKGVCQPDRLRR